MYRLSDNPQRKIIEATIQFSHLRPNVYETTLNASHMTND